MGSALGAAGLWAVAGAPAAAQVSGGTVTAGNAQISGAGTSNVLVTQSSAKAVIDWRSFSVDAGGSVRFAQPDRAAVTLNRVTGGTSSRLDGSLSANGQVWLLNPNGVIVGSGGRIAAGGFLATTHALSNDDFLAGRYGFTDAAAAGAAVVNAGRIAADEGGYAVLAGRQAANLGLIEARLGTVALGAARQFTLDLAGDKLLSFAVAGELDAATVVNHGALRADGGRVLMSARAAADIVDGVVNNQGLVQATSVKLVDGRIVLDGGERGTVLAGGRLDASGLAAAETGGTIAVLGDTIVVGDGATLDARGHSGGGEVYVGGGWQGETVFGHQSAVRVAVAPTATLDASAVTSGNGGTVVAWSDVRDAASRTYALGTFRADGGAKGGNGGRIETSGHDLITTGVRGSAAAPHGTAGSWLFDPYDIEIVAGNSPSIINPGFENGLTGWTALSNTGSLQIVTSAASSSGNGKTPVIYTSQVSPGGNFLLATAGQTGTNVGVQQSFSGTAGQTFTIYGLFLGQDYLPFNDTAVIDLVSPSGAVQTLYSRNIQAVGDYGTSPWQPNGVIPVTLESTGGYTLRAYVRNVQDGSLGSQLGFEVALGGASSSGGAFGSGSLGQLWTATTNSSKINVNEINALLSAGTNVHVSTAGPGTQAGDITVSAAITKTGEAAAALKLEADRSIIVNQGITSSGGKLDVTLLAKTGTIDVNAAINVWPSASAGKITLDAAAIRLASQGSLRGGDIELIADSFDTPGKPNVDAQNSVSIAPRTLSRAIRLGQDSSQGDVLSLGAILKDLEAPTLVIGHAQGTGTIEVTSNFTDQSVAASTQNVVIRTPGTGGRIEIKSNISIPGSDAWRLVAGGDILLDNSRFDIDGALELVAGQRFINHSGSNALETGAGGRWLVYSADPALSTFDGLISGATALWGQDFADAAAGAIETTGNRYAFGLTPTLTVSAGNRSKTYGETLTFGPGDFTVSGLIDAAQFGNVFAQDQFIGTPVLASAGAAERANAGSYSIEIGPGTFGAPLNYDVTFEPGSLTVDRKALSLSLNGEVRKTYDGTTGATLSAANYTVGAGGVLDGDEVAVATTVGSYADKNAGAGKLVTIQSVELTGVSAANYRVVGPVSGKIGQIDPKAITGTATVANKIYDGTTVAAGTIELADLVPGELVVVGGASYNFVDKNVGTGKTVNVTNVFLSGAEAGNYALTVGPAVADIAKKRLDATVLADDRMYDGTTAATGQVALQGVVAGDAVATAGSVFAFADKNAGVAKHVDVSGTQLFGADAGNYDFVAPTMATATISPKAISASVAAQSKIYDGTTTAAGSVALNGVIAGDLVSTAGTQFAFTDKNAGLGKTVNVTGTALTGADAANYVLGVPATTVADILQKLLTANVTASDRTYDGTTAATGELTLAGVIDDDKVSVSGTQFAFLDKNAGSRKTVSVTGAKLIGADAGNYTLTVGAATADITQKAITGFATAASKTYDGTTAAAGTITLSDVVSGDAVVGSGNFAFDNRNAGIGKTVNVTDVALTGVDASNYVLTVPMSATADIFQKPIGATITAASKTYDGNVSATGAIELHSADLVLGDIVGIEAASYTFGDKNAGTGKAVTANGVVLTGDVSSNYSLLAPASAVADIFRKPVDAVVTAASKVYDGTTGATGSVSLVGQVPDDQVSISAGKLEFASKNAGLARTVNVSGVTLNGADADNYLLTVPATVLADIFQRLITATATADDKTYDGNTGTSGRIEIDGDIEGDDVAASGAQFAFNDKHAGLDKLVTITGVALTGADAANYLLDLAPTTSADITPKAISALVAADDKIYDGGTAATGTAMLVGTVEGDAVATSSGVFAFADKNAGTEKLVSVSGVGIVGADAGNYVLTVPASTTADILKKAISASAFADNKIYDGTTAAKGRIELQGVVAGDLVSTTGTQFVFANRNAATGKSVNVSGTTLTGVDAGNYALTTPATTVADILKKVLAANATASAKTYDGTTAATGGLTLTGVVDGDKVSVNGTRFAFADKAAGTGKTVNISGARLSGQDADNYSLTAPATTVADILRKQAGVQASAANKIYDGTTAAAGTVGLTGLVTGDLVAAQGAQFAFADANAGTGKAVSLTGLGLAGADAGNYVLGPVPTLAADITPRALTASLTGSVAKVYDATTAATLSAANYSLAGFVDGEGATVGQTSGSFASPNVGSNIVVTAALAASNFTANSGTSLSNYLLPTSASGAIGAITPATLTYVANAVSRPRGNPNPALGGSVTGFVGGETQANATSGLLAFATPAALDSPIGTYAIEGSGLSAANYMFVQAPGNASAFRVNEAMSAASTVANTVQAVAPPPTPAPPPAPAPSPNPAPGPAASPGNAPGSSAGPAPGSPVAAPPPPPPPPPPPSPSAPQAGGGATGGTAAPPPPPGPPVEATPPSPVGEAAAPTPSDSADQGDPVLAEADTPEEEQDEPTGEKRQVTSTTVVIPGVNVEVPTPPRPVEVPGAELPFSGSANPAQW